MRSPYSKLFGALAPLAETLLTSSVIIDYDSVKRGADRILLTWHSDWCAIPPQDIETAAAKGLLLAFNMEKGRPANIRLSSITGWTIDQNFDAADRRRDAEGQVEMAWRQVEEA